MYLVFDSVTHKEYHNMESREIASEFARRLFERNYWSIFDNYSILYNDEAIHCVDAIRFVIDGVDQYITVEEDVNEN